MLQTWAAIAQKGGAGKTTLSLHMSIALADLHKAVEVLDVDPQQSAYKWLQQREPRLPKATPIVAAEIFKMVERIRHKATTDIVVVDTSPRADRDSLIVASAADLIIVPCRPSTLDITAVTDTLEALDQAGHIEKTVLVLNAVASSTKEGEGAAQYLRTLGPTLCPFFIGERVDFRHSLLLGQGVTEEKPGSAAAKEIVGATKWMLKHALAMQEKATNVGKRKPIRAAG